ncbi:PilN domain-containing protein [Endothiovibrio diazotrophicus]
MNERLQAWVAVLRQLPQLPPQRWRRWRQGGERDEEVQERLLLLCADRLIDPVAGREEPLAEGSAEAVARAARRLLPGDRLQVALALPGDEFFALALDMPGLSAEQLHDAVRLQLPDLLPGVEQPMALRVLPPASPGGRVLALWLDDERAESLFHAFEERGLFLAALAPRPALIPPATGHRWRCEAEGDFLTCVEWSAGRPVRWLGCARGDLEQPALRDQWREALVGEALAGEGQDAEPEMLEGEAAWSGARNAETPLRFVPRAASLRTEAARRHRLRRRQLIVAAVTAGLFLGVWGLLAGRMAYFESKLERLKVDAREASRLRAETVGIETRLAPVRDFPDQDVAGVIKLLNARIPRDSWIERLQIDGGVVELEGYSPDPAGLVAALAETPRFEEVAFSRATRGSSGRQQGDRFGIRFRLAGVDVAGYLQEHLPVER